MKKLIVLLILLVSVSDLSAKGNDTAYYRRPYYLGVSVGYNGFVHGVFAHYPSLLDAWNSDYSSRVNWSSTYGLLLAFPFARHWELEIGLEGCYSKGWDADVTGVHYDPENPFKVVGLDYSIFHAHATSLTTRVQVGYEVFRRNNYAMTAGAEIWMGIVAPGEFTKYNDGGYALVLKSYIPVSHANGAIQVSGIVGNFATPNAMYVGLRVGFCLKGMRVYRHKPRKYYTRTYESGE